MFNRLVSNVMLFKTKKQLKGIESFDPEKCRIEKEQVVNFIADDIAMGCSEGCWSGCIGSCKYNSH